MSERKEFGVDIFDLSDDLILIIDQDENGNEIFSVFKQVGIATRLPKDSLKSEMQREEVRTEK